MQKRNAIIYEYNGFIYIIQRARQNQNALISASENTGLFAKLSLKDTAENIGDKALGALENYDQILPLYPPWELKSLRKLL